MAWVRAVEEHEASATLKEIYDRIRGDKGRLGNLEKVRGLIPDTMLSQFELYKTLMFGNLGLTRIEREMIVVVVSSLNHCRY